MWKQEIELICKALILKLGNDVVITEGEKREALDDTFTYTIRNMEDGSIKISRSKK